MNPGARRAALTTVDAHTTPHPEPTRAAMDALSPGFVALTLVLLQPSVAAPPGEWVTDGSWQDVEHEMRYSWLLPSVRYVFRAVYEPPHRIDFHRISGDLKQEEGTWLLTRTADGTGTVVEYEVYVDPGFWIPQALVARSLRKDIPAVLTGLRACVEHEAGQCVTH